MYMAAFLAGLVLARNIAYGAIVGLLVGLVTLFLWSGLGLLFTAAGPLTVLLSSAVLVDLSIFALAGAAGGLVRRMIPQEKA
jgi:hypothetical protein